MGHIVFANNSKHGIPLIANTPKPPYYAIIFTAVIRTDGVIGYAEVAKRVLAIARHQPRLLG